MDNLTKIRLQRRATAQAVEALVRLEERLGIVASEPLPYEPDIALAMVVARLAAVVKFLEER